MQITVLTGAGISAESGLATFRNSDGLWAKYRIEEVCTPEALRNNRNLVIDFYNMRRKEVLQARPNLAHLALAQLEHYHHVNIVTQNVDDLHERAGSTHVLHLHGSILELRSAINPKAIVPYTGTQPYDTTHDDGSLLRPNIVFFGEDVPLFENAQALFENADLVIIIGTSLQVYPAASLIHFCKANTPIYLIDPENTPNTQLKRFTHIQLPATRGTPQLVNQLTNGLTH